MADPIPARNAHLAVINKDQSLASDFYSNIIDFKEMNTAMIQAVTTTAPTDFTGSLTIEVSLLCYPDTFVPYPDSERVLNTDCNNFGWTFCCVAFRYARVCYTSNTTTDGVIDIYARGRRT